MLSKKNSHLANAHAPLSASQNSWTNYSIEQLEVWHKKRLAANHGTQLHEFAATCIRLKQRLDDTGQTLNTYVNDAIGFRMVPEQVLFYSMNCFGTADAITDRDEELKIFDLKTGLNETTFRQHETYAALYCLEQHKDPFKLADMEFRIYQSDDIKMMKGDPIVVSQLMDTIKVFSKHMDHMRLEVE